MNIFKTLRRIADGELPQIRLASCAARGRWWNRDHSTDVAPWNQKATQSRYDALQLIASKMPPCPWNPSGEVVLIGKETLAYLGDDLLDEIEYQQKTQPKPG